MKFRYESLISGDWEVIMKIGLSRDRRFALCTHENDAEHIVECLNKSYDYQLPQKETPTVKVIIISSPA